MNHTRKAIVMVDDEKSYVDLLANMLTENLGWQVCTFTRPLDALAALPGLSAGIVVTDYHMPQLDGFEFIARAAPMVPGVPFIMITGHSIELADMAPDRTATLRALLPKPFGWRRLADEIIRQAPEFSGVNGRSPGHSGSV